MNIEHYEQHLQEELIMNQLKDAYPHGATRYQLAPLDQLHVGGIKATLKLIDHIEIDHTVLEVGSGLGGLLRVIQKERTRNVIGLEICHRYNRLNKMLSSQTSDPSDVTVVTGDAHKLPFPKNMFDRVIFQHSLLNMPEPATVMDQCDRVLKTTGEIILHEILAGPNASELKVPVPWAASITDSHLITEQQFLNIAAEQGFVVKQFSDWSEEAKSWKQKQSDKVTTANRSPAPVSPSHIFGESFSIMAENVMINLKKHSIRVCEIILVKN